MELIFCNETYHQVFEAKAACRGSDVNVSRFKPADREVRIDNPRYIYATDFHESCNYAWWLDVELEISSGTYSEDWARSDISSTTRLLALKMKIPARLIPSERDTGQYPDHSRTSSYPNNFALPGKAYDSIQHATGGAVVDCPTLRQVLRETWHWSKVQGN